MNVQQKKENLRRRIWKLLTEKGVAIHPLPCFGRIPNFKGSYEAAKNLSETEEWKNAETIVCNPDFAQRWVRFLALKEGKVVIMATPRLKKGYLILHPQEVKGREKVASTIRGAFRFGKRMEGNVKPDLIVTGCVAVDLKGNRLGKGGGYGDREIRKFRETFGHILVATTVHELQIVENIPTEPHDEKIDLIATPERVIRLYPTSCSHGIDDSSDGQNVC